MSTTEITAASASPVLSAAPHLGQEWITLQNNYEQYEKGGLLIKLSGVVLWAFGLALLVNPEFLTGIVVLLLWLQEGIYRTYQGRLGARILQIETLLKQDAPATPFQLHSEWLATRPGVVGLLMEYAKSALRPTVAFPYGVLLLVNLVMFLTQPAWS